MTSGGLRSREKLCCVAANRYSKAGFRICHARASLHWEPKNGLVSILPQEYRDTNGSRIVIQIGGVYTTFCKEGGMLLQKHRNRNERCIAIILFKSMGVRGRFDSPDKWGVCDSRASSLIQCVKCCQGWLAFASALLDPPHPGCLGPQQSLPRPLAASHLS